MVRNSARFWKVRPMPQSAMRWRGTSSRDCPRQENAAALERIKTRQAVEQGGLAGAVGTDYACDLPLHHIERHVFQRNDAAEAHGQSGDPQQRLAARANPRRGIVLFLFAHGACQLQALPDVGCAVPERAMDTGTTPAAGKVWLGGLSLQRNAAAWLYGGLCEIVCGMRRMRTNSMSVAMQSVLFWDAQSSDWHAMSRQR